MFKYLYGKKEYLDDFIQGRQGLRYSDIAYYSVMGNEQMRDDELAKRFVFDKNNVVIQINDFKLDPNNMAANPFVTLSPQRCFCACFSGKKNDPKLYERFKADVCLEIDIAKLVELLTVAASKFSGMAVVHRDVTYYPSVMSEPVPDLESALFYKRDIYSIEDEYRVALTVPQHRKAFLSDEGVRVEMFSDDPADLRHLFINGNEPDMNSYYLESVSYRP